MPKPIPPEQRHKLEARGVVIPGPEREALPGEIVARVLGGVGLPHSEKLDRLDTEEETPGYLEAMEHPTLMESYQATHGATLKIVSLIGESLPGHLNPDLIYQLDQLKPTFDVFEAHALKPEVVLTPARRDVAFWENLVQLLQDSPLNPEQPDPENSGQNRKLLRNGGLLVNSSLRAEWQNLTNPNNLGPKWQLSVTSGLDEPHITSVTSYGYSDEDNELPDNDLDDIMQDLNLPTQRVRVPTFNNGIANPIPPLVQPIFHPSPEAYLVHQLTRIVRDKEPIDQNTWSWLKGTLTCGRVPAGRWIKNSGQVCLGIGGSAGDMASNLGVRPSARD